MIWIIQFAVLGFMAVDFYRSRNAIRTYTAAVIAVLLPCKALGGEVYYWVAVFVVVLGGIVVIPRLEKSIKWQRTRALQQTAERLEFSFLPQGFLGHLGDLPLFSRRNSRYLRLTNLMHGTR